MSNQPAYRRFDASTNNCAVSTCAGLGTVVGGQPESFGVTVDGHRFRAEVFEGVGSGLGLRCAEEYYCDLRTHVDQWDQFFDEILRLAC